MSSNFTVIYDACVLYPAPLRDLLMRLALTDLYRARWTDMIHDEWTRNVLKQRPDLKAEDLERTRSLMNTHVRDSLVTEFEHLIPSVELPDADDRHVVAAAIHGGASLIVTFNLKDFPQERLKRYNLTAQHPDDFIFDLLDLHAARVCEAADRAIRGLAKLQDAARERRILPPGVISVISPETDGASVYHHFVNELGIERLHLLLPDYSHDNFDAGLLPGFKSFIAASMNRWLACDMERVRIRMFDFAWIALTRGDGGFQDDGCYAAITIRSDGMLNPPDDLRNAIPDSFNNDFPSANTSLSSFLASPAMTRIKQDLSVIPEACSDCGFRRVCKGGLTFNQPEHQHSKKNGFTERSVYCEVYKIVFLRLIETLVSRGYPWSRIEKTLLGDTTFLEHLEEEVEVV